jgi:hypothetical protein
MSTALQPFVFAGSECSDALKDAEHRHAADTVGRQKLNDG